MTALVYLIILALVVAAVWVNMGRRNARKVGGDGAPNPADRPDRPQNRDMELAKMTTPDMDPEAQKRALRQAQERDGDKSSRFSVHNASMHELAEEVDWSQLHRGHPVPPPIAKGKDEIVAMVRNPRSLYVYWEDAGFNDDSLKSMLGEQWDQATPCLRVYDVTADDEPNEAQSWTIEVGRENDHWFVENGIEPGHRYVVSYERRTADGKYYMVAHSDPVRMPDAGPAADSELYRTYGQSAGQYGSAWK